MGRSKVDLAKVALQDQILAKWGPEKIGELRQRLCKVCVFRERPGREKIGERRQRLCKVCVFRERPGRPCTLLPITLEGLDCPYYAGGGISQSGGNHNG